MIKKIPAVIVVFIMLLHPAVISAEEFKYVQIFDPKQDEVVKAIQLNTKIYNMAVGLIRGIDGIYGKNNPLTDDGYAVRIPIDPAVKVQNKWLNVVVNEVYIIVPENDPPFLMIFENENKLTCFPFKGDIGSLSKVLDFKLQKNLSYNK